jgi:uncharacterized protein (TIGR00369 family)
VDGTGDPAITIAEAQAVLDATPFAGWWGVRVDDLGPGWAVATLAWRAELVRPGGVLHGSCYDTVADVAMWLAIMTRTGIEEMAVTVEMKTSFLRGAASDISGTAKLLRVGRRMVFGTAEITDGDGILVAHSTLTYIRPTG